MNTALEKEEMLRSAGFRYHFGHMVYVNSKAKKVVSVQFLEHQSEDSVRQAIEQANDSGDWRFYLTQPLSTAVKQEVLAGLR